MRIALIGSSGLIGSAIHAALSPTHEVIEIARHHGSHRVDITVPQSIRNLFKAIGEIDAVICAAGDAKFAPLAELSDEDFEMSIHNKLMGQVNVVRFGYPHVRQGGSITLTTGVLAHQPIPGGATYSLVNGGVEAFVRAAALELPNGIRVNVVSPGWVAETLSAMGKDPSTGTPASEVAKAYVASLEGKESGKVIHVPQI
jgi:NAD(P)-dependent dehydrogenase (short-subunit alcohol dehydrogenase family)